MRTMTARYPGRCANTGRPINPGDPILYDARTRRAYLDEPPDEIPEAAALARSIDPELDPDTAASVGLYIRQAAKRSQSDYWRTGGREFYRNKAGRCEDAPCCGCCNA